MSDEFHVEINPFLNNDIDKICIVCHLKFMKAPIYSISDEISNIEPKTTVFNALKSISNFKLINIENGLQKVCHTCYNKTIAALKFQRMCDKSVSFLKYYLDLEHQNKMTIKLEMDLDDSKVTPDTPLSHDTPVLSPEEVTIKTEVVNSDSENNEEQEINTDDDEDIKGDENNDSYEKQISDQGVVRVKCKICHKFYRSNYMISHMRVHTGERPYSCKSCDNKFKNCTDLKKHMKSIHSKIREYLCKTCGKSFKLSYQLNKHLKLHTDERPHECITCGKRFKTNSNLKNHLVTHSNERPLVCEICGKSFPSARYLSQHMISHADVKRHKCHLCGNRFCHAHSLTIHLSKHCKQSS